MFHYRTSKGSKRAQQRVMEFQFAENETQNLSGRQEDRNEGVRGREKKNKEQRSMKALVV